MGKEKVQSRFEKITDNSQYTYKGKTYEVLRTDFTIKDPTTREWVDGILYMQIESGLVFARDKDDFINRFKLSVDGRE